MPKSDCLDCLDCSNFKVAIIKYNAPMSYNIYKKLDLKDRMALCKGGSFRILFCSEKDLLLVMPPTCKQFD